MYVWRHDRDVAFVYGWHVCQSTPEENYRKLEVPKTQLVLAALMEHQVKNFASILGRERWRQVAWYPGCHAPLATAEKIILYAKEQDVPLLPDVRLGPADNYAAGGFNKYVPLACSVSSTMKRDKFTHVSDLHHTLGLHRRETKKPAKLKTKGNWRFFAQTELASYWYWGLAPDEWNRFKYERD